MWRSPAAPCSTQAATPAALAPTLESYDRRPGVDQGPGQSGGVFPGRTALGVVQGSRRVGVEDQHHGVGFTDREVVDHGVGTVGGGKDGADTEASGRRRHALHGRPGGVTEGDGRVDHQNGQAGDPRMGREPVDVGGVLPHPDGVGFGVVVSRIDVAERGPAQQAMGGGDGTGGRPAKGRA